MSKALEKFCLPKGYQENPVRTTMDSDSGYTYWNSLRLSNSYNYQHAVYKYAADVVQKYGLSKLVDVGCGPAMKLSVLNKKLPDLDITGFDQPHPIQFCKDTHDFGTWHADDFENPAPDLKDIQGELVICSDVIEHVLDPDKLLSYLASRCKPGGYVLISTPDRDREYGVGMMKSGHKDHIREWNKEEFAQYLTSRGWKIEEHFHVRSVRIGLSRAYIYTVAYHFLEQRPKYFDSNQVILAKAP